MTVDFEKTGGLIPAIVQHATTLQVLMLGYMNQEAFEKTKAEKKVTFSQHALQRMQNRNLDLSEQDLAKLDDTVEKMAQKGAKESLIYMNDMALVVSVENKTVITAMDGSSAKENIFTNIDSAAIL